MTNEVEEENVQFLADKSRNKTTYNGYLHQRPEDKPDDSFIQQDTQASTELFKDLHPVTLEIGRNNRRYLPKISVLSCGNYHNHELAAVLISE